MNMIDFYLDNLLKRHLKESHIPYRFIRKILDDIKLRMISSIAYWDKEDIRKTILFPSLDEALYYAGSSSLEVKQFVVTTIRNSMLEIACSDDCSQFKINEHLSNEEIRNITTEACYFFRDMDFSELSKQITVDDNNVYKITMEKYPLAWDYLYKLANLDVRALDILGCETNTDKIKQSVLDDNTCKVSTNIENGFTLEFNGILKDMLDDLINGTSEVFYVDNFKMIARNFEKVLHVLEIVLQNNKVFCTSNYYVSRNHIEKRKRIQRAAHNDKDFINNLRVEGAPKELSNVIEYMKNNIR